MAAVLVRQRLLGGGGGQGVVANGRGRLGRRQANGRRREGVVGVEGVGGGRDVVMLRGGRVRGRADDDKAGPAAPSSTCLVHSFVV